MSRRVIGPARTTALAALLLIILSVLHVWACRASASRLFPAGISTTDYRASAQTPPPATAPTKKTRDELLQKYFPGNAFGSNSASSRIAGGLGESKRKVPSCPDPLHN